MTNVGKKRSVTATRYVRRIQSRTRNNHTAVADANAAAAVKRKLDLNNVFVIDIDPAPHATRVNGYSIVDKRSVCIYPPSPPPSPSSHHSYHHYYNIKAYIYGGAGPGICQGDCNCDDVSTATGSEVPGQSHIVCDVVPLNDATGANCSTSTSTSTQATTGFALKISSTYYPNFWISVVNVYGGWRMFDPTAYQITGYEMPDSMYVSLLQHTANRILLTVRRPSTLPRPSSLSSSFTISIALKKLVVVS